MKWIPRPRPSFGVAWSLSTLLALACPIAASQDLTGGLRKENLDLPLDVLGLDSGDLEGDPPEIVIFYGQVFETDGIFFCLDQSLSMGDGEWLLLQRELVRVVTELSSDAEFGIVFFHTDATAFPPGGRPAQANARMKQSAIAMVQATQASDQSTCFLAGLVETLRLASLSAAENISIIFMSDGKATCVGEDFVAYVQRTLEEVKSLNTRRIPIHTLGVGYEVAEHFLKQLAEDSGGEYRRLRE